MNERKTKTGWVRNRYFVYRKVSVYRVVCCAYYSNDVHENVLEQLSVSVSNSP